MLRCTINKIPESNSLLQKSRLPLGILIHPFRDLSVGFGFHFKFTDYNNNLPLIPSKEPGRCAMLGDRALSFVSHVHQSVRVVRGQQEVALQSVLSRQRTYVVLNCLLWSIVSQPLYAFPFSHAVPDEFQYDPTSKSYGDVTRRPEVKTSTIEFIAPSEYMVRRVALL